MIPVKHYIQINKEPKTVMTINYLAFFVTDFIMII